MNDDDGRGLLAGVIPTCSAKGGPRSQAQLFGTKTTIKTPALLHLTYHTSTSPLEEDLNKEHVVSSR